MKKTKFILVMLLILSMVFSLGGESALAKTLYLSINKPLEESVLTTEVCQDCNDCVDCDHDCTHDNCQCEHTSNKIDFLDMSTVELLGINYTKRTIDVTYLAMGDDVGHDHVYETKHDSNQHWKECIICQKKIDIQNHSYSESWTMGDSCAQSNKLVHACSCGYSYQTPNTRAHRDLRGVYPETNTYHTINQCFYCRDNAGASSEIHYNAGGQLGCATGRSGTCSACGMEVDGTLHEAWLNPNVTANNSNHDEKHAQDASCVKCGKTLVSDYWADISYNNTRMYYTLRVRYNWNISQSPEFSASAGFYPGESGTVYNSHYSINGNEVTYYIEAQMPDNFEKSTVLYYNPTVRTADGTRFTIHQDSIVIPEKTIPQETNVVQVDVTSQDDWATAKRITISGTENYCTYVNITVKDNEGIVYADNEKALVNGGRYSYSFIPRVEADASGKVLTAYIKDSLGNETTKQFTIYKIDNYSPTIIAPTDTSTEWSRTKDMTYHAKDGGIKEVKIGFGEESEQQLADEVNGIFEREYTFTGDVYGTTVTRIYASDGLGNSTTAYTKISNLDNTAPTVTAADKQLVLLTNDSRVDVTATANDINTTLNASGSGVVAYMITTNTTKPDENDANWQTSNVFPITENGTYYVWAKDLVGNVSNYKEVTITELESGYKVNHHLMNLDGQTYNLEMTEEYTARTNTLVTAEVLYFNGFTAPEAITKNIAPDGSTVFDYYYTRNKYIITLDGDEGVESTQGSGEYFFEQQINITATPKSNYVWNKWTGYEDSNEQNHQIIVPAQDVTYYANTLKKCDVITKYIDFYSREEIATENVQHLIETNEYHTSPITIDGYEFFKAEDMTDGIVGKEDITVRYSYKKKTSVTAQYMDYYTDDVISADVVKNGLQGDSYTTDLKDIEGYAYTETEGEPNGQMQANPTVVTYKYKKLSKVITKHVDSVTGREISNQEINSYPQEGRYATAKKAISGYTYTSNSGNTEGIVNREDIIVTYYYNVNTSVVARYIDINTGDSISPDVEIRGIEGDSYTTTQKDISGYKFVSVDGQTSGNMGPQTTTITYKYEKQSRVYTSYIDEITGNTIIPDVSSIYSQGQRYTTIQADIDGYTCVGNSNNTEGEMGRQNIYVYYYYRSNSAVNVQYIDYYTNEEVASQERIDGINRQEYTTVQKDVEGYEFADAIGPTSGLMDVDPIDVYYRYKKLSNLIVHHIDANSGEAIAEDTVITYRQADNYEANPANLPGYVVVEELEQKTGKMGRENIEKTYKYKLISGGLVVKYVDIKTNEVLDQKVYDGNEADVIELEYKSIFNYFHVTEMDPDFTQITLTGEPQEVTYYYVRRSEVQFRGIDQDTGEILYTETLEPTGVEGDRYQANPRTVEGYTVVKYPENREGIYQRVNPIIIFEYKRNAGLVNVKYVDQAGNIIEQTTLTGDFDTPYRTVQKDIPNYRFVSVDGPITGVYTQEAKEVVYHYERITSKLIVKYIDEEGIELLKTETVGNMGEEYTVTLQDIEGYELDQAPSTLTGTYKETDTTLVVKMKKTETPVVESGTIIVNLIDKDGNVIGERIVNTDEVGKEITITLPDIPGYRLVNGKTITATYINGELVYDAIYEKIPETVYGTIVVKFIDENGEEIRPSQTSRDEQGKSFRFNVPEIEGYTITGQTVLTATYTDGEQILTATYEKNQEPEKEYGTITVKYVDADGNEIKESTTSRGEVGTTFTATAPEIEGYELVGNKNINDTYQTGDKVITVTYKAAEIPIEPDPKDDPAPTPTPTPEPQPQPKQEEKTVDTSDLNVALMLVVALTSVIGIKVAKKELEK